MPGLWERIDDVDERIDTWWEALRDVDPLDRLFYGASEAADFSVLWHTLGLLQAAIADDPRVAAELSAALGIESAIVNGPLKSAFGRKRPLHEVDRPYHLRTPRTTSFPSGHASAAMVAAAMLSRRGGAPGWYALGIVVATSRIHVRIHHASDVVGGLAVGVGLGAIARRLAPRVRRWI